MGWKSQVVQSGPAGGPLVCAIRPWFWLCPALSHCGSQSTARRWSLGAPSSGSNRVGGWFRAATASCELFPLCLLPATAPRSTAGPPVPTTEPRTDRPCDRDRQSAECFARQAGHSHATDARIISALRGYSVRQGSGTPATLLPFNGKACTGRDECGSTDGMHRQPAAIANHGR